jgi:hypothetical protein
MNDNQSPFKGKGIELTAIAMSVVINLVVVGYQNGKLEQRVTILEQLRTESRVEVTSQLAEIKGQFSELNRKLDRVLERGAPAK